VDTDDKLKKWAQGEKKKRFTNYEMLKEKTNNQLKEKGNAIFKLLVGHQKGKVMWGETGVTSKRTRKRKTPKKDSYMDKKKESHVQGQKL